MLKDAYFITFFYLRLPVNKYVWDEMVYYLMKHTLPTVTYVSCLRATINPCINQLANES